MVRGSPVGVAAMLVHNVLAAMEGTELGLFWGWFGEVVAAVAGRQDLEGQDLMWQVGVIRRLLRLSQPDTPSLPRLWALPYFPAMIARLL